MSTGKRRRDKWLLGVLAATLALLWACVESFAQGDRPAPSGPIPTGGFRGPTMPGRPQNPPGLPRPPGDGLVPFNNNIDLVIQNPNNGLQGTQQQGAQTGIGGQGGTIGGTIGGGGNRFGGGVGGGGIGGGNGLVKNNISNPRLGPSAKQYGFGGGGYFSGPAFRNGFGIYGGKPALRDAGK